MKGMSPEMVYEILGQEKLKFNLGDEYYFGEDESSDGINRVIIFKNGKVEIDKEIDNGICLDMPKDALIASWGEPDDNKETVTKNSIKQRLFFNGRENRQGGTSYEYQVDVENDIVVGWKNLE